MKISIIGNVGSGKTALAKQISNKLGIPHIQLDRIWFEIGGLEKENRRDEKKRAQVTVALREKVEQLTLQPSWISDGWYKRIQPLVTERADILIFLDIPIWLRMCNHFKRMLFSSRHPELNKWDDIKFFWEIIRRRFTHDPDMREFAAQYKDKVMVLRSYKEAENFLEKLK